MASNVFVISSFGLAIMTHDAVCIANAAFTFSVEYLVVI